MKPILMSAVMAAALTATAAQAASVLPPKSTWEYTFTDPSADNPDWRTATDVGGEWASGDAPFGNTTGTTNGDFDYQTFWPAAGSGTAGTPELWVRRTVDFTGFDIATATWDIGVDNGYTLWVNGTEVSQNSAGGFTFRWEYSGTFGDTLNQGENIVALALDDYGGLTAFDMQITADAMAIETPAIPLPAGLPLMLGGIAALAALRTRRT